MKTIDIAVVGATGAVGSVMIEILEQRGFPVGKLYPLASERSAGKPVVFAGKTHRAADLAMFDFSQADVALFSAGGSTSKEYAPKAAKAGCIVIDNSSEFRYEPDIPLIIPEVNADNIADYQARNIIANPNCSTIQMLVALKPIYDAVGIKRINVATYQSVSGAGRAGISELATQTAALLNAQSGNADVFPKQIAFNVVPHIDVFQENGYTREEMKMVWETQKIFNDQKVMVNPTAVRVPVFYGHSEAIHIETREKLTLEAAKKLLREAPGVVLLEPDQDYPTPATELNEEDAVYIGRLREDISCKKGLNLWVVSDNIRKGAALNAVQIAEILVEKYIK